MILSTRPACRAFTLTETVVVVGILAILISLLFPAAQQVMPRAREVKCMSHLRTLYVAFSPCATDDTGWPQVPKGIQIGSPQEQQWWLDYSTSHLGLSPKVWRCPSIERSARASSNAAPPVIHYLPTLFDARPGTPNKSLAMPWFIELGNAHGAGNLMIRADGAVLPSTPLL